MPKQYFTADYSLKIENDVKIYRDKFIGVRSIRLADYFKHISKGSGLYHCRWHGVLYIHPGYAKRCGRDRLFGRGQA